MGNPFQEESADLLVPDTKIVADRALAEVVGTHQQKGQERFKCMGHEGESKLYKPIEKYKVMVVFFKHEQQAANSSKDKGLNKNCQLFSRLFISCQTRQGDLQELFKHENQPTPARELQASYMPEVTVD